jgi:transposase
MLEVPNKAVQSEAPMSAEQLVVLVQKKDATIATLTHQVDGLKQQLEWLKRQMFGRKSERFVEADPRQLALGEMLLAGAQNGVPVPRQAVAAHTRPVRQSDAAASEAESLPFFDESRVTIETFEVYEPEIEALSPSEYEVIGQKVSYRLAQRPSSYVVMKYVRPVIKRRDTQAVSCALAPQGVIEGSRADVSFVVGLLVDKFAYHLPLYRQHQRLEAGGIRVSRPWLTQLCQQSIGLLEPVYEAQLESVRASRVKAMDETPIKAGRAGPGKMKTGYFWPVYGEGDEVCFPYFPSRATAQVHTVLGQTHAPDSVLISDGYAAYMSYAKKLGLTHAQCWAHSRRNFFESQDIEPAGAQAALLQIQELYAIEEEIRERRLAGESKRLHRLTYSKPRVEAFFAWVDRQFERQGLLPSNPFTKALHYARKRRAALEVFLTDPDVPMDTNHLERALRPIPMGRKNWNFCWTELGAKHVGIIQSLVVTCRLHNIDPYTYLVDVLQRVAQHPASRVAELTPRRWQEHFAANPMRSVLHLVQ